MGLGSGTKSSLSQYESKRGTTASLPTYTQTRRDVHHLGSILHVLGHGRRHAFVHGRGSVFGCGVSRTQGEKTLSHCLGCLGSLWNNHAIYKRPRSQSSTVDRPVSTFDSAAYESYVACWEYRSDSSAT